MWLRFLLSLFFYCFDNFFFYFYVFDQTCFFMFLTILFFNVFLCFYVIFLWVFYVFDAWFLTTTKTTLSSELHLASLYLENFIWQNFIWRNHILRRLAMPIHILCQVPHWLCQWHWFFQSARQTHIHLFNYIIDWNCNS